MIRVYHLFIDVNQIFQGDKNFLGTENKKKIIIIQIFISWAKALYIADSLYFERKY